MSDPPRIIAILTAKADKSGELLSLLRGMLPHCRAEPGNLRWEIWQDSSRAGCYVLDEMYTDAAALDAHRETPHYRYYRAGVGDLADREVLVLTPLSVGTAKPETVTPGTAAPGSTGL